MRIITDKDLRDGSYGPFYIIHMGSDSCIVSEKKVQDVDAETLEDFVKEGTTIKFRDGHKETMGVEPPPQDDERIIRLSRLVMDLERRVAVLEMNEQ